VINPKEFLLFDEFSYFIENALKIVKMAITNIKKPKTYKTLKIPLK